MGIFNFVRIRGAGPRPKYRHKTPLMIPLQRDAKVDIFQINLAHNIVIFQNFLKRKWGMDELNVFRSIADLLPHPFLELEQSCLEINSPLSEPGE